MKRKRYTDEQIAFALRQAESARRWRKSAGNSASPSRPSKAGEGEGGVDTAMVGDALEHDLARRRHWYGGRATRCEAFLRAIVRAQAPGEDGSTTRNVRAWPRP